MGYTIINIIDIPIKIDIKRKSILSKSLLKTILKDIYKNKRS